LAWLQAGRACLDDLEELDTLRSRLIADVTINKATEEIFAQYFGNLCLIEQRFPVTQYEGDVNLSFCWADAFQPEQRMEMHKIGLEKAGTIFNLGAYFSQMGMNVEKETVEELGAAGKYFMRAAGALFFVRTEIMPSLIRTSNTSETIDLSAQCLEMLEGVMVGQAVECILDKGSKAGSGPGTLARLGQQLSALYNDTYQILCDDGMKKHFERPWRYTFRVKSLYYEALAYVHQAKHLRETLERVDIRDAIRSQIGYIQESKNVLQEAKRQCSNIKYNTALKAEVERLGAHVGCLLAEYQKENASTYLLRVPHVSELQQIEPLASEAVPKAVIPPYLTDPVASVRFNSIVPEEVAKDWSKYTDMLDRLLREQTYRIDKASDDARVSLREMELPERLYALEQGNPENVPDPIKVELETVQESGGVSNLVDICKQLQDMNESVSKDLEDCRASLQGLDAHGLSIDLLSMYKSKIESYSNNLMVARKTDQHSRSLLEKHRESLKKLTMADAAAEAPCVECPMLLVDSTEPAEAVQALRLGLDGLHAVSQRRSELENSLQKTKNNDDIVESLMAMTSGSQRDDVFHDHLAKYDDLKASISDNIAKQEAIIKAMKVACKVFVDSHDFEDWSAKRRQMCARWREKIDVFKNISRSLHEGLEFYLNLSDAVTAMRRDLKSRERGSRRECRRSSAENGDGIALGFSSKMHLSEDPHQDEELHGVNPLFRR
jgi:programmed cell death 6-interacting protein